MVYLVGREREPIITQPMLFDIQCESDPVKKEQGVASSYVKVGFSDMMNTSERNELMSPEKAVELIESHDLKLLNTEVVRAIREVRKETWKEDRLCAVVHNAFSNWQQQKQEFTFFRDFDSFKKPAVEGVSYPADWVRDVWFSAKTHELEERLTSGYIDLLRRNSTLRAHSARSALLSLPPETNPENTIYENLIVTGHISLPTERQQTTGFRGITVSRYIDYFIISPSSTRTAITLNFEGKIYNISSQKEQEELLLMSLVKDYEPTISNRVKTGLGGYEQASIGSEVRQRIFNRETGIFVDQGIHIPKHRIMDVRQGLEEKMCQAIRTREENKKAKKRIQAQIVLPSRIESKEEIIVQKGLIYQA